MADSTHDARSPGDNRRVPPIDPEHLDPAQVRVYNEIAGTRGRVAGPFTVLIHRPELADRVQRLGAYLRFEAAIPRDVAELAVLVVARTWESQFEWAAHETHARRAGLDDATIHAVRHLILEAIHDPRLRGVAEFAHALATSGGVPDATYASVLRDLGPDATVELSVQVGYYSLLAMVLGAHDLEAASTAPDPT